MYCEDLQSFVTILSTDCFLWGVATSIGLPVLGSNRTKASDTETKTLTLSSLVLLVRTQGCEGEKTETGPVHDEVSRTGSSTVQLQSGMLAPWWPDFHCRHCRQQSASRPQEGHCLARHHQQLTIKQPIIALLTSQINSLPDSKKFYRLWDLLWWTITVNRTYNYDYFCCLALATSTRKKIDVYFHGMAGPLCSKGNLLFVNDWYFITLE